MKVVELADCAVGLRDALEDGQVAVAPLLRLIVGQMHDHRGVTAGDAGLCDQLVVFVDAIDPLALVAAHEALADVVGDAAAGHVMVEGEGVKVLAVLGHELVQGSGEVGAGGIVGVDPQRPGLGR